MQRLYFLTDSNDSARKLTERLLLERVGEEHIHILANADELPDDLPETTPDENSDFWPALGKGFGIGAVTGLVFATLLALSPLLPGGIADQAPVIALITIFACVVGAFGAAIVGISVPSTLLERFRQELARGRLVVMIDVPSEKVQVVYNTIRQNVPRTQYCGIEPLQPVFP